MGRVTREDLIDLLGDVFSTDPNSCGRCFWCLADSGQYHEDSCTWLRVAHVLEQGDLAAVCRVGESFEDTADRLEDEDDRGGEAVVQRVAKYVADKFEADLQAGELTDATLDLVRDVANRQESCDDLLDELPIPTLIDD